MNAPDIIPSLNQSTFRLFKEINNFPSHGFNSKPERDSWSAAEITEHILLYDIYILRLMQNDLEFAGRPSDEKVTTIQSVLKDTGLKLRAPEFAIPSDMLKDPGSMQDKIRRQRHELAEFLNTVEEESLCTGYEHPLFGFLTTTEWAWYIIYHTDRHILQLQKLPVIE